MDEKTAKIVSMVVKEGYGDDRLFISYDQFNTDSWGAFAKDIINIVGDNFEQFVGADRGALTKIEAKRRFLDGHFFAVQLKKPKSYKQYGIG